MVDIDLPNFMATFTRVWRALDRYKQPPAEVNEIAGAYFQAMKPFTLRQVEDGAELCIQRLKRFPRPVEWIELIPKRQAVSATVEALTADDADDWLNAERLRWEGRPCTCRSCVEAGVTDKPIRFVPEFDENDRDVKVRIGERVVTRGHWAHGDELRRWYVARDECMTKWRKWATSRTMPKANVRKFPTAVIEREPGEDDE
jgi:hypothetical protein